MQYWLDLFTGTTWQEFLASGAEVSGFSASRKNMVSKIQPGDILLCYLTGVQHWVGALEVLGPSDDKSQIWKDAEFPARLAVKPLVTLPPEHGVPMDELAGKVWFFESQADKGKFKGFVRGSPNKFKIEKDGQLILEMLKNAKAAPVSKEIDPKKLAKKPFFKVTKRVNKQEIEIPVSVPEREEYDKIVAELHKPEQGSIGTTRHSEIQYQLLTIGHELGLDLWVARNDRSRTWQGKQLGELPGLIDELPTQFNDATQRTIELIDVLWLKGNSIIAAFEVECTTSVYSGLLRMSDLLALQPNLNIKLYLVAPDERRDKVSQEILRPSFSLTNTPLSGLCGFVSFSRLTETIDGIRKLKMGGALKPNFLDSVAEYFDQSDDSKAAS